MELLIITVLLVVCLRQKWQWICQEETIESLKADNANLLGSFDALKLLQDAVESQNEKLRAASKLNDELLSKVQKHKAVFEVFKMRFERI